MLKSRNIYIYIFYLSSDDDDMGMDVDHHHGVAQQHQGEPVEPEEPTVYVTPDYSAAKTGLTCLPQRAALLKSMLNFLKKAIQVCLHLRCL
jgi:hypothetical protein